MIFNYHHHRVPFLILYNLNFLSLDYNHYYFLCYYYNPPYYYHKDLKDNSNTLDPHHLQSL